MNDRFEKFTERARRVLSLAQEEAQRFNHNYMGTEHLLLGLVKEGDGVAATVLKDLGVDLNRVRAAVERIIGRGDRLVLGEIGMTPRAKKVIELAVDEARRLNHHYIGTEHLLLGLLREGEGIAAGVLASLGVNLDDARTATLQVLSGPAGQRQGATRVTRPAPATPPPVPTMPGFMFGGLSPLAWRVLDVAWTEANQRQPAALGDEQILVALAQGASAASGVLASHGATIQALREALATTNPPDSAPPQEPGLTPLAQIILGQAQLLVRQSHAPSATPEHLLLALLRAPEGTAVAALRHLGIDLQALDALVSKFVGLDRGEDANGSRG